MKRLILCLLLVLPSVGLLAAEYEATIDWANKARLSLPVSGIVKTVNARSGQRIKKGDLLLALTPAPFDAQLTQAKAQAGANAEVFTETKRVFDRVQDLFDRTVSSQTELDNARLEMLRAKAAHEGARTSQTIAQINRDKSEIRSLFDGWVIGRNVEPGETVLSNVENRVLLVIAEAGHYIARFNAPVAEVTSMTLDAQVSIDVSGQSFSGVIRSLGMLTDPSLQNEQPVYSVEIEFESHDKLLRAGERAVVTIN